MSDPTRKSPMPDPAGSFEEAEAKGLGCKMAPVEAALHRTEVLLDDLTVRIDTLDSLLTPILADFTPETHQAKCGVDREGSSPIASAIYERNETIDTLITRIIRLSQQLEC